MNMLPGKIAGVMLLVGLSGCHSADRVDRGPMDMLEDRGVPNLSVTDPLALHSFVGRDVKVFGTAIATKISSTSVRADNGRIWDVQIRSLFDWPADVLGRRVHVKGVLRVWPQRLDAAGNPVNERGEIVQGFSGVREVYYLGDCVYERD